MCKSFFHVSCAHAAGFLSEPSYITDTPHLPFSSESQTDAYLAHCKLHSDRTVVKKRRRAFLTHLLMSKKRREDIALRRKVATADMADLSILPKSELGPGGAYPGETADIRILRKLSRHRTRYVADRIKSHDPWLPTQKMPRLLTTSASAIRKIQRMGVLQVKCCSLGQLPREARPFCIAACYVSWLLKYPLPM